MIKDFLILSFIGKDNKIGLKISNKFFALDFDLNVNNNDTLVLTILNLLKKHKVNVDNNFSILVNNGPGSYTGVRVAEGILKVLELDGVNGYSFYEFEMMKAVYSEGLWISRCSTGTPRTSGGGS